MNYYIFLKHILKTSDLGVSSWKFTINRWRFNTSELIPGCLHGILGSPYPILIKYVCACDEVYDSIKFKVCIRYLCKQFFHFQRKYDVSSIPNLPPVSVANLPKRNGLPGCSNSYGLVLSLFCYRH